MIMKIDWKKFVLDLIKLILAALAAGGSLGAATRIFG